MTWFIRPSNYDLLSEKTVPTPLGAADASRFNRIRHLCLDLIQQEVE
jgi:hypothetical protein